MAKPERACPRCGLSFASDKLDGLCPACLLTNTLDIEDVDDGPAFWEDEPTTKKPPREKTFSHFELLDELGRGGMGVVYRARDLNTERIVALKVLQAHHLDVPDLVQRFRAEVRAVGSLDHPHVLPIHEVGEHDGIPFFSMKLTTGGSLAQQLGAYLGKPRQAAELLAKVSRGVQHAHERGILHRDLKPGNILIDSAGEPYVCDFGLAKWLEDDRKLTVTAAVLGTPHYIAPEQAKGSKALTTAVDIYSLGAILYELLTGRPPFVGGTVLETLVASQEKTPERPSSIARNIPRDLETICLKALQHEPGARYPTAAAFAEDLEAWLAGRPIQARPVGAAEQLWRWGKRNPLPALLMIAIMGILVVTAIASVVAASRYAHQRKRALEAEADAKERLYQSSLDQARAVSVTGRSGQREAALGALNQALQQHRSVEVRNEVIAALSLVDLTVDHIFRVRERTRVQPVFDKNLEHVVSETIAGQVTVTRIADGVPISKIEPPSYLGGIEALALHELKLLAIRHDSGTVSVWDLSSGAALFHVSLSGRNGSFPWQSYDISFDSTGSTLYIPNSQGIEAYSTKSGLLERRFSLPAQPNTISVSNDGQYIATTFYDLPKAILIKVTDGTSVSEISLPTNGWHVAWSPQSDSVAIACGDFNVYVAESQSGKLVRKFVGHRQEVTHTRYSSSGEYIASTSRDNTLRLWSLKSNAQEVLVQGFGGMPALYFSQDDSHLATGTGDTRACILKFSWRPRVCETVAPQVPLQRAMLIGSMDYTPSGKILAGVSYELLEFFDVTTGKRLSTASLDQNNYKSARFLDEETILVGSEQNGIASYDIGGIKEGRPIVRKRVFTQAPLSLGSASGGTSRTEVACFNRAKGGLFTLDTTTGKLSEIAEGMSGIKDALYAPKSDFIVVTFFVNNGPDTTDTQVWSASQRRKVLTLKSGASSRAALSPNLKWIATSSIAGTMIWDVQTGRRIKHFPDFGYALEFSQDSSLLAVSEGEQVILIDTTDFEIVAQLRPPVVPSINHRLLFSPDGSILAAQGADGSLRFWKVDELNRQLNHLGLYWKTSRQKQTP